MTREEFIQKFPVGSKVKFECWSKDWFREVLCHGNTGFFWRNTDGDEGFSCYNNYGWLPYEEPKPEWDWEAEEMWGQFVKDDTCTTKRFMKQRGNVWLKMDDTGVCAYILTKKYIKNHYTPCLPPDNAQDYR